MASACVSPSDVRFGRCVRGVRLYDTEHSNVPGPSVLGEELFHSLLIPAIFHPPQVQSSFGMLFPQARAYLLCDLVCKVHRAVHRVSPFANDPYPCLAAIDLVMFQEMPQ